MNSEGKLNKPITRMAKVSAQLSKDVYKGVVNGQRDITEGQIRFYLDDVDAVVTAKYRNKFCMVAFRGTTKSVDDWMQNLDTRKQKVLRNKRNTKCLSTRGWVKAYRFTYENNVLADVIQCKKDCPACEIVLTGHSQGGALATIAAVVYGAHDYHLDPYVFTFGAPGALSAKCKKYIHSSKWFRFILSIPGPFRSLSYDPTPFELFGELHGHEFYISSEDSTGIAYTGIDKHVDNHPYNIDAHSMNKYQDTLNSFGPTIHLRGFSKHSQCTEDWECNSKSCNWSWSNFYYACT